jgi:hypothetical protein
MKNRESYTVLEIIDISEKAFPLLGWKGCSALHLSSDNVEGGDLWLFIDVNKKVIKEKDAKKIEKQLRAKLKLPVSILWDMPDEPFASIQLSAAKKEARK